MIRIPHPLLALAALSLAACSPAGTGSDTGATKVSFAHAKKGNDDDHAAPAPMAAEATVDGFTANRPVTVTLRLTDATNGKGLAGDAFDIVHTQRVHALVIDSSLTDYSHAHAVPGTEAGVWTFTFTPKHNRPYRLFLDTTRAGAQSYTIVDLNSTASMAAVEEKLSNIATFGGVTAQLKFDGPLKAGIAQMGEISFTRNGAPFAGLEPVMGAFGHIVGFSADRQSVAHVHPMGEEPTAASQRGGPAVTFHLEPSKVGFLRIYAQIRVGGQDVFLPFGVTVAQGLPGASNDMANMKHGTP